MKIKYCRKRAATSLFFCLAWFAISAVQWWMNHSITTQFTYFTLFLAIVYFIVFLVKINIPYLTIEEGQIRKTFAFKSSLASTDILKVDRSKDQIQLIGLYKTLKISTYKIDKRSLTSLLLYLKIEAPNTQIKQNV